MAEASARDREKKAVRISPTLVIFVDQGIPDDEARETYLLKTEDNSRKHDKREIDRRWMI